MAELPDQQVEFNSATPLKGQIAEGLVPGNWRDLVIYLFGGMGLYLLAGLVAGLFFPEINLAAVLVGVLLNFICLAGAVYVFGVRRNKLSWTSMGLVPPRNLGRYALLGVILAVGIIPLRLVGAGVGVLIEWLLTGELSSLTMRSELFSVGMDSWYGVLLMLVAVGILAPISEELFFRGLLHGWIRQRMEMWPAVMLSSLVFGLAHYDSLIVVGSSFVIGVAMALAYERTHSLWITIFTHIATNSAAILLLAIVTRLAPYLLDGSPGGF